MARRKPIPQPEEPVVEVPTQLEQQLPKPMPSNSPQKGDVVMVRMKGYNSPIHNPDQNRWIMDDVDGVQIVMDNWTLSQIKAGLVEVVPPNGN